MMNKTSFIDYLSLGILVILALAIFLVRILMPDVDNTPLVNTLFSFFEITFSILIGFILQRLDSTKRFQQEIRKYGLSAYRRISDISKSLSRAKREISLRRRISTDTSLQALDVLSVIIDGTDDTVKSSITDWADIIGDDLKTQEKIQELETNLSIRKMSKDEDHEDKIRELQNEISMLRSKLPYALQFDQDNFQDDLDIVDMFLGSMVSSQGHILINLGNVHSEYSDDFISEMKRAKPYTLTLFHDDKNSLSEICVYDCRGDLIGKVINPFISSVYIGKVWSTICSDRKVVKSDKNISVLVEDGEITNPIGYTARIFVRIPVSMYAYQ